MRRGALGALVAVLALVAGSASAQASEHVLNPTLSLTGACGISEVDPVADPGLCPIPPGTVFGGAPGADHPSEALNPNSVTTDSHGDIYVASYGSSITGEGGRVDVFDPEGLFITEKAVPAAQALAVDSKGNLYVVTTLKSKIFRYPPSIYEPPTGEIEYAKPAVEVTEEPADFHIAIAVDPLNDRLFVNFGGTGSEGAVGEGINEFGSAAEGNKYIETIGAGIPFGPYGIGLAIDAARERIYASSIATLGHHLVYAFELEGSHAPLGTFDGSTRPEGSAFGGFISLAVDESNGDLFVYDGGEGGEEVVYEFAASEDGEGKLHEQYVSTINYELKHHYVEGTQIAVDNGAQSPNGAKSIFGRYLFVPAFKTFPGHLFALGPPEPKAPEVEIVSFSGVTEAEAQIEGKLKPNYVNTTYTIEYIPAQQFREQGETFAGAAVAAEGQIPAGGASVEVAAPAEGLEAGTAYRFRIRAENEKGSDEKEGEFATYPETPLSPCENEAVRRGLSALLPDCRAYELVTPPNTNGRPPGGVNRLGTFFATREASPTGDAVSFQIEGGIIPGYEATGSWAGDPYGAHRTEAGWVSEHTGPDAAESPDTQPGGISPDQGYSFWRTAGGGGSAEIGGKPTTYLHYPDGHSALIGRGSLGADPYAVGKLISANGGHVIFESGAEALAVQLEEGAPPAGTKAVYDRRIDPETGEEETKVVSLLPGNLTPAASEAADYEGASLDGEGVAFKIGKKLYLRYRDEATYEIAEEAAFAGVAEGGGRIFYLKGGNLFAYDVAKGKTVQFTNSSNATPVNIAGQGRVAYFASPSVLVGEENPTGAKAKAGQENLYRSKDGVIAFVGTLTNRDVEGEFGGVETVDGLGLWMEIVGRGKSLTNAPGRFGADPSRATPDGSVLLFESRAKLTAYDPEGHAEVYRYDFTNKELACLSCNPTLAPATGEASLQSLKQSFSDTQPFTSYALVENLRPDGRRAFFQTTEALVPGDVDGLGDVYEWEAEGVGSCAEEGGCVYLISSGHSPRVDYLYAVGEAGDDVFIRSSDQLLEVDGEETASLYDARVGGGFPEPAVEEECQGEGCKPGITPPPALGAPAEPALGAEDNVTEPRKQCPKGTRKVKNRCVKKHHKHKHRQAGAKKKGAGK
jgi:hypothetical protein